MCSVVGYIGDNMCRDNIIQGLARLEYRGYDSAGFACLDHVSGKLWYQKEVGKLEQLVTQISKNSMNGYVGIGHTRWATHGLISWENSHPQVDCTEKLSIVHNGIIENYREIKQCLLQKGHVFISQTDTEVVAHSFEEAFVVHESLVDSVVHVVQQLQGAYACILLCEKYDNQLIAVRKGSPLCLGVGTNEVFVASDVLAFAGKTNNVIFLQDETFAVVKKNEIEIYDFSGNPVDNFMQKVDISWQEDGKDNYDHFMLKEMYEQQQAIFQTISFCNSLNLWQTMGITSHMVQEFLSIHFIACGTSWHAALIAQFFFETLLNIPVRVSLASELRYRSFFPEENCLYIAISQSGETADTLECVRLINAYGLPTVALTNVASSSMVRESGGFLLTCAGQEIAVASTKSFSAQLALLFWLAHRMACEKNLILNNQFKQVLDELFSAACVLQHSLEKYRTDIEKIFASRYAACKKFIFLGRGITYPLALEAALKLKEISYIFAQAYPAGELKHGSIALVDEETPVVVFSHADQLIYKKLLSNVQEVKARKGHVVAFVLEGQQELVELADTVFVFPRVHELLVPLAMTGVMQFFAYQIAKELGCSIDKPRNLAKSATVE